MYYLMGYASGLGFDLVLWFQTKLVLEAREFTPLYKGGPSDFRDVYNLTELIYGVMAE